MSLQVGLVGIGFHARGAVIPAIAKSEYCELTAACDLSQDNLDKIEDDHVSCFTDYQQMLDAGGFDLIYVSTLEDLHKDMVIAALDAGYHVMCEKPLGMNADECREMLAAEQRSEGVLAVGFEKRYHHDQRQIRQWVKEGRLGKVEAVHFQEMWDGHKTYTELAPRRAAHLDRSGCLDCGIHCLDIIRYLTGGGNWANIAARGRWFGEVERKQAPHISVLADLDTGVLGSLTSSYAYCANIPQRRRCFSLAVVGDRGCVNWAWDGEEMMTLSLICESGVETLDYENMSHSIAIRYMMDDLAQALEGTIEWPDELATGQDGLIAQLIIDESLRQTHEYDLRK